MGWQAIDATDPDEPRYEGDPADLVDAADVLLQLVRRPAWQRQAACAGGESVDLFFPRRGESTLPARSVCAACPVRTECEAYAIAQDSWLAGIWAGTSERERRHLRRKAA